MTLEKHKATITITDDNFEKEVIKSDIPVLVDFWAEWCGPCKVIGPTIEELAGDYTGRLKVGKLNVDDNPQSARRFGIQSIPTLTFFKNGEAKQSIIGVMPKGQIAEIIDKTLN